MTLQAEIFRKKRGSAHSSNVERWGYHEGVLVRSVHAELPSVGPCFRVHDALHPQFRARSIHHRGVVNDDSLVYSKVRWNGQGDERCVLTVVLSGHQRVSVPGERERWLGAGEFAVCREFASTYRRDQDVESRTLSIEWNPGFLGSAPRHLLDQGRLGVRELGAIRAATETFEGAGYDEARGREGLAELLSVLRAAGIPLDGARTAADLFDPRAAAFAPLSHAMDRCLTVRGGSGELPMSVDLESATGLSRWQVARQLSSMNAHLRLDGGAWRQTSDHYRLMLALLLLSHENVTSASVAKALGYGASPALYHAFSKLRLPAPGRVREALAALE